MGGYVVSKPLRGSNVGSNLASLAGAIWLARRLGRAVVVDWRERPQLADQNANYFAEFFETPAKILDVPLLYAPLDGFPEKVRRLELHEAWQLSNGEDLPLPEVVMLTKYHGLDRLHPGPESSRFAALRAFYRSIHPGPAVRAALGEWFAENLDGTFVVGLNVRTGNGHYFGRGGSDAGRVDVSLFDDRSRLLRALERHIRMRLRRVPRSLRDGYRVFYATDSADMAELLGRLPRAVTRRNVFPPPGAGDTFRFDGDTYTDRDAVCDTLVDMFLLARCDALIYNNSLFNQYARTVTGAFSGNQAHLETLFLRYWRRRVVNGLSGRLR